MSCSTDVATLFLDTKLNIRFFTPAIEPFFRIVPSDVGRPLVDLHSLAADDNLRADARAVLQNAALIEREIEAENGTWFLRRISPYRTHDNRVEGVVITLYRYHREEETRRERAGGGQAGSRNGQCREITLSRRREP
jgi:two-component system CheB/CheR fusion protein